MAIDDDAVLTAAKGYIFVAPQDTVSPSDAVIDAFTPSVTGLAPAWQNLGHTSRDDLPEFGFEGGDTETRGTWQNEVVRQIITEAAVDYVTFNLLQFDVETLELYYGATNAAAASSSRYTVQSVATSLPTRALLIIIVDGDTNVAFYAPRTSIRREDAVSLATDEFGQLPVRATVLGGGSELFSWIGGEIQALLDNPYVGLGDSITSISGGAGYGGAWALMVASLMDQRLDYRGNAGVAGQNSTQILARVPDVIALGAKTVTVLAGTNDLTQGVSTGTFQANIQAIVSQFRAAGVVPVLATIPPRANTTFLAQNLAWNSWLRSYAETERLVIVDFWEALVNPATNMFAAGFDSGDGLHPSQQGHLVMARLARDVLTPEVQENEPFTGLSDGNILSNPVLSSGSTGYVASGTVMTGYTEGVVTDSDFDGDKAWEWNFTNPSNAAGFRQFQQTVNPAEWSVGETLLFTAQAKVVTQTGVTPGNNVGFRFAAGFTGSAGTVSFVPGNSTVHEIGRHAFRYVVPASTTAIQIIGIQGAVPVTGQLTSRIGSFGVFNLTRLGLV